MLVVIASKIPESVRGKIKLWFIEPKPYVFVSSVSDAVARKVVEQLIAVCDDDSELLIVESQRKAPGYQLYQKLKSNRILEVCGVQLIKEAASETDMKKVLPKQMKPKIWVGKEKGSELDGEQEKGETTNDLAL